MNALQSLLCLSLLMPFLNHAAGKQEVYFEKRRSKKTSPAITTESTSQQEISNTLKSSNPEFKRQESFDVVDSKETENSSREITENISPEKKSIRDVMFQNPSQYATPYKGTKYKIHTPSEEEVKKTRKDGEVLTPEELTTLSVNKELHKKKFAEAVLFGITQNKAVIKLKETTKEHTSNPVEEVFESLEVTFDTQTQGQNHIDLSTYQLTTEQKEWLKNLMLILNFKKDEIIKAPKTLRTKEFFEALRKIREETRKYKDRLEAQTKPIAFEIARSGLFGSSNPKLTCDYLHEMTLLKPLDLKLETSEEDKKIKIDERNEQTKETRTNLQEKRRLYIESSMNNKRIKNYSDRRNIMLVTLCDEMSKDFGEDTRSVTKRLNFLI